MSWKYSFVLLFFIISCKQTKNKFELAKQFYSKIQNENVIKLLTVEFGTRGDIELWTYYLNSDYNSTYVWSYYLKKDSFDLIPHPNYEQFKKEVNDPLGFVKSLENKKNSLGIKGISNSPWPGHFVKFWFSDSDILIYQPEGFKIDSDTKQRWLDELNKGIRIDQNWVCLDLSKI